MEDCREKINELLKNLETADDIVTARKLCKTFICETDTRSFQRPANMEQLLVSLLDGTPYSEAQAKSVFEQFAGILTTSYILMIAACENPAGQIHTTTLSALNSISHCWSFAYQERTVCLVDHSELAESFDAVQATLLRSGYSLGISRPFSDIAQLRAYYDQAFITLKTLFILGRAPACAQYDDFLMIRLLEGLRKDVRPHDFALPDIQYLQGYDKKHNSELARTLLCYLERSKNVSATAETMHIHRNTVHYRINKCMELLPNLDFSNDYIAFLLLLSLHIAEFDFYQDQKNKAQIRI